MDDKVGIIIGTKPASPLEFYVAVEKGNKIGLDECIYCKSEGIEFFGIVTEVYRYFEGVEYAFENKLAIEGLIPIEPAYIIKVNITRIEPEIYIPPDPGTEVFLAKGNLRDKALYYDQMENKIPAGISKDKEPVYINYDFISGKEGAHISISGMSGVATKTSYILFLISSIIQKSKENNKFLIFNVKGKDLLFIDKKNKRFSKESKEIFKKLELDPIPFKATFFCPPKEKDSSFPESEIRLDINVYGFDMYEIAKDGLLKFMFADTKEDISNLSSLIDRVNLRLNALAKESKDKIIRDDKTLSEINSLEDLKNILTEASEDDEKKKAWFGNHPSQTIFAFLRRLEFVAKKIDKLIKSPNNGKIKDINLQERISVIDISDLHSIAKMFVVGATLYRIFKEREESGISYPKIFIVVDELNKYAPKDGWSPIKDILLDIAERGRSMGVILIGAQQTASEVEKRIIANSAIKVLGRLDSSEIESKEYGFLPYSFKQRAIMLKKGTMILYQPDIPMPIVLEFPFAPWATRKEEVEKDEDEKKAFEDITDIFDI